MILKSRDVQAQLGYLFMVALLGLFFTGPSPVHAQNVLAPGTQIETRLRPIVWLQYGAGPFAADQTAVGIFDSGDPAETLARETAVRLGVPVVTPLHAGNPLARNYNQGATGPTTVNSGGWLGGTFDLERLTQNPLPGGTDPGVRANDPSHVFTNATGINRTAGLSTNNERLWYLDYNRNMDVAPQRFGFTENHTSTAFVSGTNPANNLVVFVDPINGTPLPFAYDNSNGNNNGTFTGNGRNVLDPPNPPDNNPANLDLDQRGSSVSYLQGNNARVPTPANNTNPGFVYFIDLTPREFSSTLTPNAAAAGVVVNNALPAGTRNLVFNGTGATATQVLPRSQLGTLDPEYQPADAAGNFIGYTSFTYTVGPGVALGNQTNPNGFVRADGSVNIVANDATPAQLFAQNVVLPSQAPRPFGSIVIPALGINTGALALLDTGAPTTTPGVIVGTDILNRFGQFWDFRNVNPNNHGRLTLIAPSIPEVVAATGNGIVFNVDQNTTGLARSAVEQERLFGSIPQLQIGAATAAGIGGGDNLPNQAHGTVFRTHLTGSNASYIDEAATQLNRGAGGQVMDANSLGADGISIRSRLFFSVDGASNGQASSPLNVQKVRNQSASDIYASDTGVPVRNVGNHRLFINQEVMGLGPNFGPLVTATPSSDNLLDFDLYTAAAMPARSFSNLDSPIEVVNDSGTLTRARVSDERYAVNFDQYFSIRSITGGGATIFRSQLATPFALASDMGLMDVPGQGFDDLDALALFRPSVGPGVIGGSLTPGPTLSPNLEQNFLFGGGFFVYDPNDNGTFDGIDMFHGGPATDLALFSLSPDSATLGFFGLSPADIFITDFDGSFTLYATAESLGLNFADNIDGLDSLPVPEPGAFALLASSLACLVVVSMWRQRPGTLNAPTADLSARL